MLAEQLMRAGLYNMTNKFTCVAHGRFEALRDYVQDTGCIRSVMFFERLEGPSVTLASEPVAEGAIERMLQTGESEPRERNRSARPVWSFDCADIGSILTETASPQIEHSLYFAGINDAEVKQATVTHYTNPDARERKNFDEQSLRNASGLGYLHLDCDAIDAGSNWRDERLTALGTGERIKMQQYLDVGGEDALGTARAETRTRLIFGKLTATSGSDPYDRSLQIQHSIAMQLPANHPLCKGWHP